MTNNTVELRAGDPRRWWALGVLCMSLVLITLDNTILNVALPTLARDLHASTSQLQWIVDSYQLVFAGLLFTAGSLADRYGRKGMLQLGLVVFGLGTFAAAFADRRQPAHRHPGLHGHRWGDDHAVDAVDPRHRLPRREGACPSRRDLGRDVGDGHRARSGHRRGAAGPLQLGLHLHRQRPRGDRRADRWPVPPARRRKDPSPGHIDLLGSFLSIVALGGLVFAVIEGPDKGWTSTPVVIGGVLGLAAALGFLAWESHTDSPMLDLDLFRNRGFSMGALTLLLSYFGALGTYFLYTQHLQFVLGYSALKAGVYSLPFAILLVTFSLQTPRLIGRWGTARVAGIGVSILTLGVGVRALATPTSGFGLLLLSLAVSGIGVGLIIAPSTGAIMGSLKPNQAGVGSAINDAARQVGSAAGVAVLGSIWSSAYKSQLSTDTVGDHVPANALHASSGSIGSVIDAAKHLPHDVADELVAAAKAAFVHGSNVANVVAAIVLFVAAILAFRFLPGRAEATPDAGEIALIDAEVGVEGPEAWSDTPTPTPV